MEFVVPTDLPKSADKKVLNSYLEEFYNFTEHSAVGVPLYFWQGSKAFALPAKKKNEHRLEGVSATQELKDKVYEILRGAAGLPKDSVLTDEMQLAGDLGIDSLALMNVASEIEMAFDQQITNLEALHLVEDCVLLAAGQLAQAQSGESKKIPDAWFATADGESSKELLSIPQGKEDIISAFLWQVKNAPNAPLMADRSGMRTRAQVLLGAILLSKHFAKLPDKRIGIMLPAAPAAAICWLGACLAGKEPVMFNWTVGKANMEHCLAISGVKHMVTASALLEQVNRQDPSFELLPVNFLHVDKLVKEFSLLEKLRSLAKLWAFRLGFAKIVPTHTPENAVVLFTSGSEARPKGVPLSHKNLLTNAGDIAKVLNLHSSDRVLAMLPPFHSFGLMVGVVLPLSTGMAVAYHPKPTEAALLVSLVRDYKLTLLGATPTFLDAMLQRVQGTDFFASVRFAFVGAEKCPEHVAKTFAKCCPEASLCEGYGITECSPVVSVNVPGKVQIGSIGYALPSLEIAIVKKQEGEDKHQEGAEAFAPVPQGQAGILLVRGESIFSGYLGDAPSPFVHYAGKEWYSTGDLVLQQSDGCLVFQGRLKRFVKIGGEMISLPQMESVLQKSLIEGQNKNKTRVDASDNTSANTANSKNDEGVKIVVDALPESEEGSQPKILAFTTLDLSVQEINQMLKDAGLSALYAVKDVVKVKDIPLLGTGKTDYRALQEIAKTVSK